MIINPANLQFAFYGLQQLFQQVIQETPVHWPDIASETKSETEEEFYAWLQRLPELREWVGPRQINNLAANVTRLKNKLFEDTFGVPRTKFEDDKYGIFTNQAVRELAFATKLWPDQIITAAILAGETALAHDGQAFFSASHPVSPNDSSMGTQSNLQTAKPLSFENVNVVRAVGESFKAENGVPLELVFDTLIVPPQLKTAATQIATAEYITPTGTTTVGAAAFGAGAVGVQSNVLKGQVKPVVLPRLAADPTTWYLACTNRAVKPFIFQNRQAAEFAWLNKAEDHNVFLMDEYVYGVRARGAAGYGPWFLAIKVKAT